MVLFLSIQQFCSDTFLHNSIQNISSLSLLLAVEQVHILHALLEVIPPLLATFSYTTFKTTAG